MSAETTTSTASAGRRLLRRLLLLSLPVLVVAAAEGSVRLWEWRTGENHAVNLGAQLGMNASLYMPHPYVGWVLRPGVDSPPGARSQFHINALGFRGPELTEAKPAQTLRVACLGGSTTYGDGASSDATTWPSQLEGLLQQSLGAESPWKRVECINEGVHGYTLMESYVDLKMRVMPLDPDIIVVYHAINDANVIGRGQLFKPDYTHYRGPWNVPVPAPTDVLFAWSHLYGLLRPSSRRLPNLYDVVYRKGVETEAAPEQVRRGVENYRTTLHELVALARVHGCEVVLATFGYSPAKAVLKREGWMKDFGFAITDQLNAVTREVAESQRVLVAPVSEALAGDPRWFGDAVHLTDEGNGTLARAVAQRITASGMLNRPLAPRALVPIGRR